ncbi:MAG: PAS domain-containing protein [Elusimicrobiota bacterium]
MTTSPPPPDEAQRQRSLRALDLLDAIKRAPLKLTDDQELALSDVASLVRREVALDAVSRPVPPARKERGYSITSGKVLTAFSVVLAGLIFFSVMTLRAERRSIGDFQSLILAHEELESAAGLGGQLDGRKALAAAEADRLGNLLIVTGLLRFLIVGLALYALLRGLKTRDEAEELLRRAHADALNAAEDRRVAQAEAEKLGERLRAVLDHIDVGVTMINLDGSVTVFNRAAERIHGAWREQMERLNLCGSHPPMAADEKTVIPYGESPVGRALQGQSVRDAHVFFRTPYRPNGYHLSVSAIPLRDHQGLMAGAVLMFSERKK